MGKSRYVWEILPATYPFWTGGVGHHWPTEPQSGVHTLSVQRKEDLITSQGNPFHLLGKSNRRIGGNFHLIKQEYGSGLIPTRAYSNTTNPNSSGATHYVGPVSANGDGGGVGSFPSPLTYTNAQLDAKGTTAIANVLPTNPLSGLFVSLGELKSEGIPSLGGVAAWKNRTRFARSAGDEYLNHQFGWVPLVNELRAFSHSVTNSDELIRQYDRNSGRKIKRVLTFPIERSYSSSVGINSYPSPTILEIFGNLTRSRRCVTEVRQTRELWFSGCFTYYLPPYNPEGNNIVRNEQLANYLYGTRVTPEGIWDLTPWSWAADWVGNFGDVLHNVSAFQSDGLTMLYGYIMYRTVHEITKTNPDIVFKSYPGSWSASFTKRTIVKGRRVATPYGFGLDPGTFSDRQWAILAALGLSRGSRQLYD